MTTPAKSGSEVEVEVERREGGQVRLSVRVPSERVAAERSRLVKALARRADIPGFRKGKAPRAIVERHIDQEALKREVVDSLVSEAYEAAVAKAEITPLTTGRIEGADLDAEGALRFAAEVVLRPEMELPDYKGMKATRRVVPVTEEQVEAELQRVRERLAQYVELGAEVALEVGDLAVVDYDMVVDGKKREEGSVEGYPLEVGADELFPQLNEVLVGARVGETRTVTLTYPADHPEQGLAGKTARFEVAVRQARRRQLPELNDEFARRVSDLETMEALRGAVRRRLEAVGEAIADMDLRQALVRQVCDGASVQVPEALVSREVERRVEEAEKELARQGTTLRAWLASRARPLEDWRAEVEAEARLAARRALVLDEIGRREGVRVSDEEVEEEIRREAALSQMGEGDPGRDLSRPGELDRIADRLYQRKVVQLLVDHARIEDEVVAPEQPAGEGSGER